ncbi:ComEC/Rec2 family competence protein [Spiroplasma endosymbiont of Eupeodes luniger]|uniref:ComEC/Rec2 family competence protein n=1 Tax=Spiroplasma endosymbiont of Eupeodes luniger TaxID=3066300 RepID=UPI0030CEB2E9
MLITNVSYYSLLLTGVAILGFVFYNMKFYWKYFFFIVIFLFIVLIFLLVIKTIVFENHSSEQWLTVKVVQKYCNYYVVEYQKNYLMIKKYFFNISLNIADQVKIKGIIFKHQAINNFHQYNLGWDYYGKHIVGEIKLTNKQYFHYEAFTLRNYIWKWLQQYDYNNLLDFFLLQNYSDNHSELLAMWQKLNISHLLVVSGFHINLQITLLRWVLCKLIKKSILRNSIIFAWLSFYVYLLNWQLSALRALLYWTGSYINKIFKLNISSLDLWAVICCFFLIMNPLVLYQTNWQFSFLISLIIIYVNQICWNFNKIMKLLFTQLTISIITLPITIYMQGHINLLFLVHQIIFSSLVQIFYYFFSCYYLN